MVSARAAAKGRAAKVPSYRLHRASGQARVIVEGEHIYLGVYGSPESHEAYERLISAWLQERQARSPGGPRQGPCSATVRGATRSSGGGALDPFEEHVSELTIDELIAAYWRFVVGYYVKNGEPTHEQVAIRIALRWLRKLYGSTAARRFGPRALGQVRARMISERLARTYIRDLVNRIRRLFRWAVSEELLPVEVYQALKTLPPLKRGRSAARETAPIKPVTDEAIDAVLPFVSKQVAAMIQLQRYTGARPGEILILRPCDLERGGEPVDAARQGRERIAEAGVSLDEGDASSPAATGASDSITAVDTVWWYRPASHKTEHLGQDRVIALGPRAQRLLKPWLEGRPLTAFCFRPDEAESERRSGGHRKRRKGGRAPGACYTKDSYRRAIRRACKTAGVEPWSPNRIRHSVGTQVRRLGGIETARAMLGHTNASTTEIYAEQDKERAAEMARRIG